MSEIAVTERDQGRVIEAQPGDLIVFRLEENLTTGYGWEAKSVGGSVVELIESTYVEATGKMMGRGGTRVLRFSARSPGSQEIHLQLRRPWEPPDKILNHMTFAVRVQ